MNKGLNNLPLPCGASAAETWGSLPPPAPLSCGALPRRARGDTRGAASLRFIATDAGNPCQPFSNKAFQARPQPQQRGLTLWERSVVLVTVCAI